ncbi:MAG: tyrosine-type recombinase/integrase [Chloroflexota bacterium]
MNSNEHSPVNNHVKSLDRAQTAGAIQTAIAIGEIANSAAGQNTFEEYQKRKSSNTLLAQQSDLNLFLEFINAIYDKTEGSELEVSFRLYPNQLYTDPAAWQLITHGLLTLYKNFLENEGYALSSINRSVSTIRKYASLATTAGYIQPTTNLQIQGVKGYLGAEAHHVDSNRDQTRKSSKKSDAVAIPRKVVKTLKSPENYPENDMGLRDRLILCLLLDHGLRSSEVAGLDINQFDFEAGIMQVYRQKTNTTDRLYISNDTADALFDYLKNESIEAADHKIDQLLWSATKGGRLRPKPMTRSGVSKVVSKYGKLMAVQFNIPSLSKLSAHDGRHQWATDVLASGAQIDQLQQAGGWKSPSMPLRYVNKRKVANEGINLDR